MVLCSVYLTPGGARMLKEVAACLDVDEPCQDAADVISRACDKLADAAVTLASDAGIGHASGSSASPNLPSEARMEARSALKHWNQRRGAMPEAPSAPLARSLAFYARM